MTILLYDYCELEERASHHLRVWKVWHIILYVLAAIFGVLNYVFLQSSMQLIDDNCILFPKQLEFHTIEFIIDTKLKPIPDDNEMENKTGSIDRNNTFHEEEIERKRRDVREEDANIYNDTSIIMTGIVHHPRGNLSVSSFSVHFWRTWIWTYRKKKIINRTMLDTSRSLFGKENDCEYSQYIPLFSTVCATVWATMFIMCPGGGRTRSGIRHPWRILMPALLFALVLFALTATSFVKTNRGLQVFCSAFVNMTNATTCSSTDAFIERAWNATWGMGGRAAAARAASAGVWASWACATALLLARCLTAPDFSVKRTTVHVTKDPQQNITPHLRNSGRRYKSTSSTPTKLDLSLPTTSTELVTASIENTDVPSMQRKESDVEPER